MTTTQFWHSADMRRAIAGSTVSLHGTEEGWATPASVLDAPSGFGEETWDVHMPNQIAWPLRGRVASEIVGSRGRLNVAGDDRFCLIPALAPNQYRAAAGFRSMHFYLPDTLLRRVGEGLDLPSFGPGTLRPDLVFAADRTLRDMLDAYGLRSTHPVERPSRIEMEARALLIVERLARWHHGVPAAPAARGGLAPWQLRRACEMMEASLSRDIGLDELAAATGLSPTHFSRAFKRSAGMPPFTWLLRRRMECAKGLLADPRLSLADVALAVGFAAQPQFTTAFRREAGMTPGNWRRERLR